LRFENVVLSSESPLSIIEHFLSIAKSHFGDIILVSVTVEGDKSATVDVGFRFADEALTTWQKDGFQHGSHFWKITPIPSVRGHCYVVKPSGLPPRSKLDRIQKLHSALELESHIQACAVTDPITDAVSLQMREVLDELNTFDVASASISSSGSYQNSHGATLGEIQPWAKPSEWTTLPRASMMAWMRTWTIPYKPKPAVMSLTGRRAHRALKGLAARAGPTSSEVKDAMDGEDLHQAYRATRHAARRKLECWRTLGEGIQLPPLPVDSPVEPGQARDTNRGYKELWKWYEDSLILIRSAYTASQLGLSQDAPSNLSELPRISTASQREETARRMSYAALMESFSPPERLRLLVGEAYTTVMQGVSTHH
jgi:hypothetical protein